MKRGFVALQKLIRKKLHRHETEIWRQLQTSEREFQIKLRGLKERRQMQEKIFDDLKHTPSDQFQNVFLVTKEFPFKQPRKKYSQEICLEDDRNLLNNKAQCGNFMILCGINFGKSGSAKIHNNKNSVSKCVKMADFALLQCPTLISRKI